MTKTVIVPIPHPDQDPDRVAWAAVPSARALADRTGASVVLVTAVEARPTFDPRTRSLRHVSQDARERLQAEARSNLDDVAQRFDERRVESIVRWGEPVEVVTTVAEAYEDPVIVTASHARLGIRRILVGSVAFRLVHEAPCPVLVVRGVNGEGARHLEKTLATVLVPLDRSAFAEQALETALAALGRPDVRVHLVYVIEPLTYPVAALPEVEEVTQPAAIGYLEGVADGLTKKGYRVTLEVRTGKPSQEILRATAEQRADLIAMATHGLNGLGRRLLGSTAEHLLAEAAVPLLLVHPDEQSIAAARTRLAELSGTAPAQTAPPGLWSRRVDELMTSPVIVATEESPLVRLVETMLSANIGCLPIVDDQNHLVGIVTESDFTGGERCIPLAAYQVPQCFKQYLTEEELDRIYEAGERLTAAQVMSHPVVTVAEDEPVGTVVAKMFEHQINHVPVVRDGVPVGIVTRRDLLALLLPERR